MHYFLKSIKTFLSILFSEIGSPFIVQVGQDRSFPRVWTTGMSQHTWLLKWICKQFFRKWSRMKPRSKTAPTGPELIQISGMLCKAHLQSYYAVFFPTHLKPSVLGTESSKGHNRSRCVGRKQQIPKDTELRGKTVSLCFPTPKLEYLRLPLQ